jgi:hypothetical protein
LKQGRPQPPTFFAYEFWTDFSIQKLKNHIFVQNMNQLLGQSLGQSLGDRFEFIYSFVDRQQGDHNGLLPYGRSDGREIDFDFIVLLQTSRSICGTEVDAHRSDGREIESYRQ